MEVSSSNNSAGSAQVEAMKKVMDVQKLDILKVLESTQQESQQVNNSQKTGMGRALDIKS